MPVMIPVPEQLGGDLLIIGGAEDKRNDRVILRRFVELAGGADADILIVPIASDFPEVAGRVYEELFTTFGAGRVRTLTGQTRGEVMAQDAEALLDGVTGVFMSGGDQMRLTTTLGGTDFAGLLERRVRDRLTLGGTSAGAAAMSSAMIVRGENALQLQQDAIRLSPGLGVLRHIIIDQHFTQRSRLNRLITAVCYNPRNLGIGIDEDTAVLINKAGDLEVLGTGTVTLVDGSDVPYTNIAEVGMTAPLSVFGLKLHILAPGFRYNIRTRKPLELTPAAPAKKRAQSKPER